MAPHLQAKMAPCAEWARRIRESGMASSWGRCAAWTAGRVDKRKWAVAEVRQRKHDSPVCGAWVQVLQIGRERPLSNRKRRRCPFIGLASQMNHVARPQTHANVLRPVAIDENVSPRDQRS